MVEEEPVCKRCKNTILTDDLSSPEFQSTFVEHWTANTPVKTDTLEIISSPFRVSKISNFIQNASFMEELKTDLSQVKCKRKITDLYNFEQTDSLMKVGNETIRQLIDVFKTQVHDWMAENTGIELSSKMSMSSTCYYDTNYLLCHDDQVDDRRIAFILYLSENWTKEDGGALDLFDTDDEGLPRQVKRSLVPEYNSLVFFEVADDSYHQVAEVTSSGKSRWTVNGWFHGPLRVSTRPPRPEIEPTFYEPSRTDERLSNWVMESYLCSRIMKGIGEDVEKDSYAFLARFLQDDVYRTVSSELASEKIIWHRVGPADLRNYEVAEETSLPGTLRRLYRLFKSIEIFRLLKEYTELDLVPSESMRPRMTIELQRWSKGCYTLICDKERHANDEDINDDEINGAILRSDDEEIPRVNGLVRSDSVSSFEEEKNFGEEKNFEEEKCKSSKRRKKKEEPECSRADDDAARSPPLYPDSENSQVSDIGDYLSDPADVSEEENPSDVSDEESSVEARSLDVIMQFNTGKIPEDETIDYVDPREEDGTLIHVPQKDNHLCLVYKTLSIRRLQKYVNHYFEGYYYNLVCTYYE